MLDAHSGNVPTIVAIATGPAAGGVGIVRLSGPLSLQAARTVLQSAALSPAPRTALRAAFTDEEGNVIDHGLWLHFPAPNSYTGEDVVELHAHGSPRLLSLLVGRLTAVPGVRLAGPGEFTRRAFLNGRIDLAKAEAVADLVAADSQAGVKAAAAQLSGALSQRVEKVRGLLAAVHVDLEAALNFPEEAEEAEAHVYGRLQEASVVLRELVGSATRGALARRGAKVVLYGPVNAGKSTLFNAWAGEERALVDAEPGTTRDSLEAVVEWQGLKVMLVDTAGLRENPGRLEQRGIERTQATVRQADLVVLMIPPGASAGEIETWRTELKAVRSLEVFSKADVDGGAEKKKSAQLRVSARTGEGVEVLKQHVLEALTGGGVAAAVTVSSLRHQELLTRALEAVERACQASRVSTLEVVAGEVGAATLALGDIVGADVSTELLDAIFAKFCIGK